MAWPSVYISDLKREGVKFSMSDRLKDYHGEEATDTVYESNSDFARSVYVEAKNRLEQAREESEKAHANAEFHASQLDEAQHNFNAASSMMERYEPTKTINPSGRFN